MKHSKTNINDIYGHLKVIDRSERTTPSGQILYTCECSCGNKVDVFGNHLRSGKKTHCGCQNTNPQTKHMTRKRQKHQASHTPLYGVWDNLMQRTRNPNAPNYPEYGGRGITVCDRWLEYNNFAEDMGPRPDGHTLDRIDPNGNYEPSNCRWATAKIQNMNRRSPRLRKMMSVYMPKPKVGDKGGINESKPRLSQPRFNRYGLKQRYSVGEVSEECGEETYDKGESGGK